MAKTIHVDIVSAEGEIYSGPAEMVFVPTLWPDFDRTHLWRACEDYARRDRRYGAALPNELPGPV